VKTNETTMDSKKHNQLPEQWCDVREMYLITISIVGGKLPKKQQ